MKTSKKQIKAVNRWNKKNKIKHRTYILRSSTRRFLKHFANKDDLYKVIDLARKRLNG